MNNIIYSYNIHPIYLTWYLDIYTCSSDWHKSVKKRQKCDPSQRVKGKNCTHKIIIMTTLLVSSTITYNSTPEASRRIRMPWAASWWYQTHHNISFCTAIPRWQFIRNMNLMNILKCLILKTTFSKVGSRVWFLLLLPTSIE